MNSLFGKKEKSQMRSGKKGRFFRQTPHFTAKLFSCNQLFGMRTIKKGDMVKHKTSHKENLNALKRISGQVNGVQRMIQDEKYCIDIIIQIHAAIHALHRVADKIFIKHIDHCVRDAFVSKSKKKTEEKIDELMKVIKSLHKLS